MFSCSVSNWCVIFQKNNVNAKVMIKPCLLNTMDCWWMIDAMYCCKIGLSCKIWSSWFRLFLLKKFLLMLPCVSCLIRVPEQLRYITVSFILSLRHIHKFVSTQYLLQVVSGPDHLARGGRVFLKVVRSQSGPKGERSSPRVRTSPEALH